MDAFAAFPLLEDEEGRTALRDYFAPYLATAREHGAGFLLDTATWRANADWGAQLGYDADALVRVNVAAVSYAQQLLERTDPAPAPVLISGVIGPRGDGYEPGAMMSAAKAAAYHAAQVETLAVAGADLVAAITLTYPDEAVGIARAATEADVGLDGERDDGGYLGAKRRVTRRFRRNLDVVLPPFLRQTNPPLYRRSSVRGAKQARGRHTATRAPAGTP